MALEKAKKSFLTSLNSLKDSEQDHFLNWTRNFVKDEHECSVARTDDEKRRERKSEVLLSCIKGSLREKVPFNGMLNSENINFPTFGIDANLNNKNCLHVDAFLYDDDDVDILVESGKISNNYCKDCNSSNIEPKTFISHSASKDRMKYIFQTCLPPLKGKVILDIGSRLGVVLYVGYCYTEAAKIVGVELNQDLCDIQKYIVDKYKLHDRIHVLEGNILDMHKDVKGADVIVLMNVFEWFLDLEEQIKVWNYLFENIKSGAILVTSPPIDVSLDLINSEIDFKRWVEEVKSGETNDGFLEETEFRIYKVI